MKISVSPFFLLLLLATSALADDQLRNVQGSLKTQGFFYGDVNGQPSAETTAAIRRYQIRNGLEVTGALSQETLETLKIVAAKPRPQVAPTPEPPKNPPSNLRKDESGDEADRAFLESEATRRRVSGMEPRPDAPPYVPPAPRDPSVVRPPVPLEAPGSDFPVLFARTPYATAPAEVQQRVLRNAQAVLAGRGFYRDIIDGLPGPASEEALLTFQRASRLTLTGRLDLETLSALRLLPNTRSLPRNPEPAPGQRVYRGIWVN